MKHRIVKKNGRYYPQYTDVKTKQWSYFTEDDQGLSITVDFTKLGQAYFYFLDEFEIKEKDIDLSELDQKEVQKFLGYKNKYIK